MTPPDPLHGARRILIYGVTGAGKTTLAARFAKLTGIPWHEVDSLTWEPGWKMARTLGRLLARRLSRNGNRENLRQVFSRDSVILVHFESFPSKRERIRRWSNTPNGPAVVRLTSPRQTRRWLAKVEASR